MLKKLLVILTLFLSGCSSIVIQKPDKTKVSISTFGTTKIIKVFYERTEDPNEIRVLVGDFKQTPEGIDKVIESTGSALGAGLGEAGKHFITP